MALKSIKDFDLKKFLLDLLVDVVIVLVLVVLIRQFLFAPFRVHGPSMCDTFNIYNGECFNGNGEYVLTSRLSNWDIFSWSPTQIERGDVIIFQAPYGEAGEYFIKRVIGLPGDLVKIENGLVYLMNDSGEYLGLQELYLSEENQGKTYAYKEESATFDVPEGMVFVMGDNRNQSSDSRRCFKQLGCSDNSSPYLSMELIEGEVKVVIFPLSHIRWISSPEYSTT